MELLMLGPLIAGVTTGTPIKVEVPNTDQRGHVSAYTSSLFDCV